MTTDPGHAPNRAYLDGDGCLHLNGATIYLDESGTALTATDLQFVDLATRNVPTGAATLALTVAAHEGRTVVADQAAGVTYTLPSAVAGVVGAKFRIVIGTSLTSNSLIVQVANANDYLVGLIFGLSDDGTGGPVDGWATANSGTLATESDTVTLNRTTTGTAKKGQELEFECIAANVWQVRGKIAQSGTEATPFSAAV
jgi:hypothetical protein